ncbi:phosphatase PAP2 family protein [Luteimonas sp. MJ174]|uniref:phosphatase PAP2 family protein n=1 Tax=Luteimonas sp. MJ174 TaxID=3129237 RepID=UPI0031BB4728
MFEADPILWLQGLSAPWFAWCMHMISGLGDGRAYVPAVLVLLFGVRLRPGLGVLLALMLVVAATDAAKHGFGLPRPSEVDARILDEGEAGRHLVGDGAADGFWALPSPAAITAARARRDASFGFVSGHTSAATAFVLAMALLLRARRAWVWGLVVAWPLLMGVSRMYLGRHFLADVLGGLVVGVVGSLLAVAFMRRLEAGGQGAWRAWLLGLAGTIGLALASGFVPWLDPGHAGGVAGTLLCIGVLMRTGFPDDAGGPVARMARVLIALALAYGILSLLEIAYAAGGWPSRHVAAFVAAAGGYVAVIIGAVALLRALRLYRPAATATTGPATG